MIAVVFQSVCISEVAILAEIYLWERVVMFPLLPGAVQGRRIVGACTALSFIRNIGGVFHDGGAIPRSSAKTVEEPQPP